MDDSDSSSLSSAPEEEVQKLAPIFVKAKKATKKAFPPPSPSPPRPKREPSPPHEHVLADNPAIAFLIMFRSRFADAFPAKMANLGPQDIERGVTDSLPSPQVESLLCALLGLVLNRKKPVERGHYGRALEEAMSSQKSQWPYRWAGVNPLHGGNDFNKMLPTQRLDLLRTLGMWALTTSEAIQTTIKEKYKQNRHNDDENQPLSVQPWGNDGDKRRYFLIQGLDDTGFRVYREGSRYTKNAHWYSVAGDIEEVRKLAEKLEVVDGTQAARRLGAKMLQAIPMFEATEEKRRRREYRQNRRAAFSRPEPGFSLYEGRTRGKRTRYNYDDDDTFDSDDYSTRRSTRQSAQNTPYDSGPEYTASGRQVKKPRTGDYGESLLSGNVMNVDELSPDYDADGGSDVPTHGRATRSGGRVKVNGNGAPRNTRGLHDHNDVDDMTDEDDAGDEWDSDQNGVDDEGDDPLDSDHADEEDEESSDDEPHTLVVTLKMPTNGTNSAITVAPRVSSGEKVPISSPTNPVSSTGERPAPDVEATRNVAEAQSPAASITPQVQSLNVPAGIEVSKPAESNTEGLASRPPNGTEFERPVATPTVSLSGTAETSPTTTSAFPTPASASFSSVGMQVTPSSMPQLPVLPEKPIPEPVVANVEQIDHDMGL